MSLTQQILSKIPGQPLVGLQKADQRWQACRQSNATVPEVVQTSATPLAQVDYDILICGGTLGIMLGAALAQQGWRIALLEQGELKGRQQEWNISHKELQVFVRLGLLDESELMLENYQAGKHCLGGAIATHYNPARIQFQGGPELWVEDVLNVGVDPVYLLNRLKQTFLQAGGILKEYTPFHTAVVHPNGVQVTAGEQSFTTRLLVDAMGHFSPISRQARQGRAPDAVCLVVGTCAAGYPDNERGDLIVSITPIRHQCQYFWEAFPAREGRTTYLFTYVDAHPQRLSLEALFEDYFALLPEYQGVALEHLSFKRALYGFFPAYRDSPLRYPWPRLLAIGDSSGQQSPLSFGGFGAMVRHLERLANGLQAALTQDLLTAADLGWLHPYQPNLAVTWLFQKAMSVGVDQTLPSNQINDILATIFMDMAALGEPVLKPFLQDIVQFLPLAQTLARTTVLHPQLVAKILPQVGIPAIAQWSKHYGSLGLYHLLSALQKPLSPLVTKLNPRQQYYWQRGWDAIYFGAGQDYETGYEK